MIEKLEDRGISGMKVGEFRWDQVGRLRDAAQEVLAQETKMISPQMERDRFQNLVTPEAIVELTTWLERLRHALGPLKHLDGEPGCQDCGKVLLFSTRPRGRCYPCDNHHLLEGMELAEAMLPNDEKFWKAFKAFQVWHKESEEET